jgi:SOS-response transcriptional repressor LexA
MLGERLKLLRNMADMSQKDFSALLQITPGIYSHYENNRRVMSVSVLINIGKITNCNIDWLLTGEGNVYKRNDQIFPAEEDGSPRSHCQELPVVGEISAGEPTAATESPLETLEIGTSFIPDVRNILCFRVNGHSMEPDILHQDLVIILKQEDFAGIEGKICAIALDGEITIKRVDLDEAKNIYILSFIDRSYPPIAITKHNQMRLIGVLSAILRKV